VKLIWISRPKPKRYCRKRLKRANQQLDNRRTRAVARNMLAKYRVRFFVCLFGTGNRRHSFTRQRSSARAEVALRPLISPTDATSPRIVRPIQVDGVLAAVQQPSPAVRQ
jgi:hypothetical protein